MFSLRVWTVHLRSDGARLRCYDNGSTIWWRSTQPQSQERTVDQPATIMKPWGALGQDRVGVKAGSYFLNASLDRPLEM